MHSVSDSGTAGPTGTNRAASREPSPRAAPTRRAPSPVGGPGAPRRGGRDGIPMWLLVSMAGLAAIIALSWVLSELGGEVAEPEGLAEESTTPLGDPIDGVDETTTVTTSPSTTPTTTASTPSSTPSSTSPTTTAETETSTTVESEPVEPVTINDELDLDPITFDVSSITTQGQDVLDEAAAWLAARPEVTVEIAGHTDADGDAAANLRLSQARAEAVMAYLVDAGIDADRMTPVGYGEDRPIASNDTAAGKAENRRIEFVIQ